MDNLLLYNITCSSSQFYYQKPKISDPSSRFCRIPARVVVVVAVVVVAFTLNKPFFLPNDISTPIVRAD